MNALDPPHARDARFTVERATGRLVVARIHQLAKPEDVEAYRAAFGPLPRSIEPVLCADHRPVRIYSQEVADLLAELFRTLNQTWFRVAILVSRSNATLALQLQRIVRESVNPARRVFFEAPEAIAFLSESLDPRESAAARTFLADLSEPRSGKA